MGRASTSELPQVLAAKFLGLADASRMLPGAICLYTDGVKLVCDESPVLAELDVLEKKGVRLVVCKTCLDYLRLTHRVRVGVAGGMTDIILAM
jgi:intracellular sulfur oxidation DsrE/DsrF family protein